LKVEGQSDQTSTDIKNKRSNYIKDGEKWFDQTSETQ